MKKFQHVFGKKETEARRARDTHEPFSLGDGGSADSVSTTGKGKHFNYKCRNCL